MGAFGANSGFWGPRFQRQQAGREGGQHGDQDKNTIFVSSSKLNKIFPKPSAVTFNSTDQHFVLQYMIFGKYAMHTKRDIIKSLI